MKVLAVIVNIFFPGIGTLLVEKWAQAIAQIVLGIVAAILVFTGIGIVLGGPLGFIVWVWAIVSAATSQPEPVQVVVVQQKTE